jgi:hypothetical protein
MMDETEGARLQGRCPSHPADMLVSVVAENTSYNYSARSTTHQCLTSTKLFGRGCGRSSSLLSLSVSWQLSRCCCYLTMANSNQIGAHILAPALLALLSTTLRAILVAIVSQVISQRKWLWYGKETLRPLSDLQKFDSGIRGSLGAMLLLSTVFWKDMVTLAAATCSPRSLSDLSFSKPVEQ